MTLVYIVNGRPRAGKDTLIEYLKETYRRQGYRCSDFSSIDPLRNALTELGINVAQKTAADRKLLATVGSAVEEHSFFRTNACLDAVQRFTIYAPPGVFFLHVREPEIITRVRQALINRGHSVIKVLVSSIREEQPTNQTDTDVVLMPFDYHVKNDGSLEDLKTEAVSLVDLVAMRKNGMKHAI